MYLLVVLGLSTFAFGTVSAAFLFRWKNAFGIPDAPLAIIGIGSAPFVIAWLLNILLLLVPGAPHMAAIALVLGVFLAMAISARTGWSDLVRFVKSAPSKFMSFGLWPYFLFTAVMIYGAYVLLSNKPLLDHDILEYAVQGKIFLRDMQVRYEPHHYDPISGFYYVGLHGFAFPLLFTWEGLLGGVIGRTDDLWMRSLTPFYAWLIASFIWAVVRRQGALLGMWAVGLLALTLGYLYLSTIYHIDPLRDFLFAASFYLFYLALQRSSTALLLLWGTLLGAHALTHSIGMVLGPIMLLSYVIFAQGRLQERIKQGAIAGCIFIMAGGFHYLLDVAIGTGWIFKEIKWF